MMSITLDKQGQEVLDGALKAAAKEPVALERDGEEVGVLLSPEMFARFAGQRQKRIKELLADMRSMAETAQANGLTEEVLNDILADDG